MHQTLLCFHLYSVVIYDEEEGIIIPLHVEKEGNRNYNKAEADGTLKILGQEESTNSGFSSPCFFSLSSILILISLGKTFTLIVLLNATSPSAVLVTLILISVLPQFHLQRWKTNGRRHDR